MGVSIDDHVSVGKVDETQYTRMAMMTKSLAKPFTRIFLCLLVPILALACKSDLRTGWNGQGDAGDADVSGVTRAGGAGDRSDGGSSDGLAAAGGAETRSPGADLGTPSAESIESFCQGYYAYYARALATCATGSSLALASALAGVPDAICLRIVRSVHAGRSRYDSGHGAACLAVMGSSGSFPLAACDGIGASVFGNPDCLASITPAVPAGGTCGIIYPDLGSNECMDGTYCSEGSQTYACAGTCVPFLELGATCTWDGQKCRTGTTCNAPISLSKSTPGQCVADVPAGTTCRGPGGPGCASGLECLGGSSSLAGICGKPATSGPCTSSSDCAAPTSCVGATGQKTCVAPKADGASCTPGARECLTMSACNARGVCDSHLGLEGESCGTIQGEMFPCDPVFYCDAPIGGVGVCRKRRQAGDACTGGLVGECPGYQGHCDSSTLTCISCDGA